MVHSYYHKKQLIGLGNSTVEFVTFNNIYNPTRKVELSIKLPRLQNILRVELSKINIQTKV